MYKVIIIDDEDLFINSLINKIAWPEYNLIVAGQAANGELALDLIDSVNPDIIICDIKMPVMDGLTLLKNIQNIDNTKFIILSGYNDFEFTRQAIKYGAFDYILKPVKEEEFIGVLMRAVDSLNSRIAIRNSDITICIELRKMLVERYESLFIHFTETRDTFNINKYIDDFYTELESISHPEVFSRSFTEFIILANKICEMFKLDSNSILSNYPTEIFVHNATAQKDLLAKRIKSIFKEIIDQLICSKNSEGKKTVKEVLEYIEKNYNQRISLCNISQKYYINPSYFSQLFKNITNENFSTYLIKYRIEKAKELLTIGSLRIYQVAEMVGYDNEKHFSILFKKYTGKSPSEYNKNDNNNSNG